MFDPRQGISEFLPFGTGYMLSTYQPSSNTVAFFEGVTGTIGQMTRLGEPFFFQTGGTDSDSDGIPDIAEAIVGTDPNLADTDRDRITDSSEFEQDLDPLSFRSPLTGIMATLPLQGQAKAIILEGSTTSTKGQTAYVATGSHGLAIVDASQFQRPAVLGQIDLSGNAVDVAVDSRLGIAAVAASSALHLVDVSDATAPLLLRSIATAAVQVEAANGLAYVAAGTTLKSYNLRTGELSQVLPLGSVSVDFLARDGNLLYAVDAGGTLRTVDISGLTMRVRGTLALPAAGGRISVGNGVAYIGAGNGLTTADVSDPDSMHVLSGPDSTDLQGHAVAANGSGLGLLAGLRSGPKGSISAIDILDVSDPTRSDQKLATIDLPTAPFDLAIGAGIAFIAEGTSGLQVVNYLPFDTNGQPPTITVSAATADLDPATSGIQAPEGSLLNVKLDVTDDMQVRNVELLVDGQVVSDDVSFPWTTAVALPKRSPTTASTTIQARATDTGGNTTLSDPLAVELVPDTFSPTLTGSNLVEGSVYGPLFRMVRIAFSDAMDPTTLNAQSVRLVDELGHVIAADSIDFAQDGAVVQIALPTLAQGKYQMLLDQSAITDRAGNAMGVGEMSLGHFEIVPATIVWANPFGGEWNTPDNWDQGRVPDATDRVLVKVSPGTTITVSGAPVHVQGLESFNLLILKTTLQVDQPFAAHESVTLDGGTLSETTIDIDHGKKLIVAPTNQSNRVVGVTINGDVYLRADSTYLQNGQLQNTSVLRVKDLVLNGTATLVLYSSLVFEGTQRLDGNARITLVGSKNTAIKMQSAGVLTLGSSVLVSGEGIIKSESQSLSKEMHLVNEGTIRSSGSITFLTLILGSVTNTGTIEATNLHGLRVFVDRFANTGIVRAVGYPYTDITGTWIELSCEQQLTNAGVIEAIGFGRIKSYGNFTNLAEGTVRLGVGEILGFEKYGQLNVTGSATLDGTLSVFTIDAFVPSVGKDHTLVSFASRMGTFATLRDENPADGVTFVELDASLNVTLSVVAD